MIVIPGIEVNGKIEPQRQLTAQEKSQIIAVWFYNNEYTYYVIGEEQYARDKEIAVFEYMANDLRSGNPLRLSNQQLILSLQDQYPDNFIEVYMDTVHPQVDIFNSPPIPPELVEQAPE
jgi:hypothetical protein